MQGLHRNVEFKLQVPGPVDVTEPTLTQGLDEAVTPSQHGSRTDGEGVRRLTDFQFLRLAGFLLVAQLGLDAR